LIHKGALVFVRREYTYLAVFVAVVAVLIWISDLGWRSMVAFLVGAACSALAGYIGMFTATRANVRTTTAAAENGAPAALTVAFYGGSIMGLTIAAMGLLGLGILYLYFGGDPETAHVIHGFGMGASSPRALMSVLISLEKSRLEYQKMIPEIQALLPTTWAIMSAT
jgi:K(+)-stimulated pyrophosphate-energized sodium pump